MYDNKYIEFLQNKRREKPLKIPRYLSEAILQDRQLMKALCVWIELKPLFYDGRFKNAKQKRKSLARYLCMSVTAFNYKVERLCQKGLMTWQDNGDLVLCSWDQFFDSMGHRKTDARSYKFYRLKNDISNSEYLFRFYAIRENYDKQRAVIDKKLYESFYKESLGIGLLNQLHEVRQRTDIAILDRQRIESELIERMERIPTLKVNVDKRFKKFRKRNDFNFLFMQGCREYFQNLKTFNYSGKINFDISVSCKRMAALYGLSSASSGHYWQRIMQGHFWRVENRSIYIKDASSLKFHHARITGNLEHHYFEGMKRGVFRRLNNLLHLIEPVGF